MLRREVEGNKIKSRASHSPGGGALLRGGWAGAGGGSRRLRRTQARRAHMVPGSLRGRRVTVVARLGGSLASRLPGTTSGLGPAAHPGWRGAWVGEGWWGGTASGGGAGAEAPPRPWSNVVRAELDQSPRRSSPWQPQHQARPPRGALAAKSPSRRRALQTWKSVAKMHALLLPGVGVASLCL